MKVTLHKVFVCTTAIVAVLLCMPHFLSAQSTQYGVGTIVIDPGHGGKDPGCVSGSIYEKNIVLAVSLQLGEMIKKNMPGVKVIYTRDKDVAVDLYKRGELAMKSNADLFVSIHVNATDPKKPAPAGTETFVMSYDKATANLDVIQRENDAAKAEKDYEKNYAGFISGSPESFIRSSLQQYANTDQSIMLARRIEAQYSSNTSMPSRGTRQQNILVLWNITVPAILTEIGFINNEKERRYITSKDGQKNIATSLFNAISEYKAKVEGNSNPVLLASAVSHDREPVDNTITLEPDANPIVYRIQIHSVPRKLSPNGRELKPFPNNVTERKVGSTYKYYVGSCATYDEAAELQKEVRKTVKDAFMVAFDGENQITVGEARKLTK